MEEKVRKDIDNEVVQDKPLQDGGGSGHSGQEKNSSKDSDRSVWLPYVIAGVAIVVCGVIIWCII